jgi:hypothetical protein
MTDARHYTHSNNPVKTPSGLFPFATILMALKILNITLMLLRGFSAFKGAQVPALPVFRILLFRIQAVLP